jgi:glycosyltransferase involved in cell wall biosynthesis
MNSAATADVAGNMPSKSIAVIGIRGLPANYGGLETCADEVAHRWVRQGNDVRVYCRKSRYSERPAEIDGINLVYTWSINTKSLDTISHTFFSIVHLLFTGTRYKYVHLYNTGNAIFIPILKLFGKKVVLSGDGIEWRREKWGALAKAVHKTGERIAVRWADTIVVDNAEVGHYYANKYQVETAEIAYGANDLETDVTRTRELLEQYKLTAKEYFLFVGRLAPEKGVHNLIAAYKQLDTTWPLVIIGDDSNGGEYRDSLFAQASDDIRFLGFIYNSDYEQLLLHAYLYVSASELEGTSPSLVSAMGAGVCALVNGIEENVATTKDAACLYEKNSQQDLVHDWQQLIDEPDSAAEFAAKGRACVEQYYRWDAIAEQYLVVMGEID